MNRGENSGPARADARKTRRRRRRTRRRRRPAGTGREGAGPRPGDVEDRRAGQPTTKNATAGRARRRADPGDVCAALAGGVHTPSLAAFTEDGGPLDQNWSGHSLPHRRTAWCGHRGRVPPADRVPSTMPIRPVIVTGPIGAGGPMSRPQRTAVRDHLAPSVPSTCETWLRHKSIGRRPSSRRWPRSRSRWNDLAEGRGGIGRRHRGAADRLAQDAGMTRDGLVHRQPRPRPAPRAGRSARQTPPTMSSPIRETSSGCRALWRGGAERAGDHGRSASIT